MQTNVRQRSPQQLSRFTTPCVLLCLVLAGSFALLAYTLVLTVTVVLYLVLLAF
jgi:hypothetical protein